MSLILKIREDLKAAMKAGETQKRDVLRAFDAMVKNEEIATGAREEGLSDEAIVSLVKRAIKQRSDAHDQYADAGREDLAQQEQLEIEVLNVYMPAQLSEEEVKKVVEGVIEEVGAKGKADMGRVMGAVMQKVGDQADGGVVRTQVEGKLASL